MKKFFFLICCTAIALTGFSQRYGEGKRESAPPELPNKRWFIGGSLGLGAGSNTFNVGANPEIGYTLEEWLDVGVTININYSSESADPYYNGNIRTRAFTYGGGPFLRLFPVKFLFVHGGVEQNWIKYSQKDMYTGQSGSITVDALSLIGGIGYTQRMIGQSNYYLMIGMDFRNDVYSPYRNINNTAIPIIRGGINIYFH
jgi:hypothetical protein